MNLELIKGIAARNMKNRKTHMKREKGYVYYHGIRVAGLSLTLRKLLNDMNDMFDDIIYAGALFHDIGKGMEKHSEAGAALTTRLLKDECSEYELNCIMEIVRFHPCRVFPNEYPQYVKIVQDADIVDHMGTMTVWLNFIHNAYEEKSTDNSLNYFKSCEYKKYLSRMRDSLNFDMSRKVFDDRTDFVDDFMKRFEKEAQGNIF